MKNTGEKLDITKLGIGKNIIPERKVSKNYDKFIVPVAKVNT
jgi:hypothetical protein